MNINHIYPVDDFEPHLISNPFLEKRCECMPRVEIFGSSGSIFAALIIHNSWDGRELLENVLVCNN